MATTIESDQRLHLVFGGELENLDGVRFRDVKGLDIVGIYPDYASAQAAGAPRRRRRSTARRPAISWCTAPAPGAGAGLRPRLGRVAPSVASASRRVCEGARQAL